MNEPSMESTRGAAQARTHAALREIGYETLAIVKDTVMAESCISLTRLPQQMASSLLIKIGMAGETLDSWTVRYPARWIDATLALPVFGGRWNPLHLVPRRWPPRYVHLRVEARALYPRVSLPEQPYRIVFDEWRETSPPSKTRRHFC